MPLLVDATATLFGMTLADTTRSNLYAALPTGWPPSASTGITGRQSRPSTLLTRGHGHERLRRLAGNPGGERRIVSESPEHEAQPVRAARGLGARASGLRRHNLSTLLERLHLSGPASRSELSASTGLNRSTIADLVQELVMRGLVIENGVSISTGPGRPSPIVHVRPSGAVVVAVELNVDSVAVATVGLGGKVFDQVRAELPRGRSSPSETVQKVAGLVKSLLAFLPEDHALLGVGVAIAGLARRSDGFVHLAPNLGWRNVPVGIMISQALGQPPERVWVANEADLGALGEHRRGAGIGVDNLIFISGEVGVGAGLIIGGRPMLGAAGYAGEVGHMLVNPNGERCQCGARGCWETEAGETALLRAAGSPEASGLVAVDAVVARLGSGDPTALSAVARIGHWLGVGVGDLVNLMNPDVVVLGGMFHRLFSYLRAPMLAAMKERSLEAAAAMVSVVPSDLGTSAQLLGAAELCLSEIIADPSGFPTLP
jgi:predicted NBD/HSP70 family sugar kinase